VVGEELVDSLLCVAVCHLLPSKISCSNPFAGEDFALGVSCDERHARQRYWRSPTLHRRIDSAQRPRSIN
jgi:hypothetical protein